jgi:hypothetical protein
LPTMLSATYASERANALTSRRLPPGAPLSLPCET